MPYNGYSEEYLDRLENGNIAVDNKSFSKRKYQCWSRHDFWRKSFEVTEIKL